MKAKKGFNLRTVCNEQIIVAEGEANIDLCNIISMNESSAYLWNEITGIDFTPEILAKLLLERYEVSEDTAMNDAKNISEQWMKAGIIE